MPPKPETVRVTPKRPDTTPIQLRKRSKNKKLRRLVLQRDNYTCQHCLNPYPESNLECDHIVPLNQNGEDTVDNCQTLCIPCHKVKTNSER